MREPLNIKRGSQRTLPVFSIGFRPFYLLASGFAAISVWIWRFVPGEWSSYLVGFSWHAHEMVFGFAVAVLSGFLLTAVRTWTGLDTPVGLRLALLAGLWLAGRVLIVTGPVFAAVVIDCLFLPCLALIIAVPVVRSRNWQNIPVVMVPVLLGAANIAFHLNWNGIVFLFPVNWAAMLGLDVFALLVALMAGRVIPAFASNAISETNPKRNYFVETISFGTLVILAIADMSSWKLTSTDTVLGIVTLIGSIAHCIRIWLWDPISTVRQPLLWILPLSYTWLPVFLLLRSLELFGFPIPEAQAFHALGVGAMGGLMLGMMARSALGHTGRPLVAGLPEITAFLMIFAAAVLRVFGPLAGIEAQSFAVDMSAILWTIAFTVFLVAYWPVLTRPRVDQI